MAQVIIRRDDGSEEVVREVENDFFQGDLLFAGDYFARKLWTEEDIADTLEEEGYEASDENIDIVLKKLKEGGGMALLEDESDDFAIIASAVRQAGEELTSSTEKTPDKPKKKDDYER
jgi:hypothetical protein